MYEEMKQQMTHLEAQLDIQTRKNDTLCQVNEALAVDLHNCQLSLRTPMLASGRSDTLNAPAPNADEPQNQEQPLAEAPTGPCELKPPQPPLTSVDASAQAVAVPSSTQNERSGSLPLRAEASAWEVTPEGAEASAWEVTVSTKPEIREESAQMDVAEDAMMSRDCSSGSLASLSRTDISIGSAVDGPTVSFGSTVNDTPKSRKLQEQRHDCLHKVTLYRQQCLQHYIGRCGSMPAMVGGDWTSYEDPSASVEAHRACSGGKAAAQSYGGADLTWVMQEWPELNGKPLCTHGSTSV